MKDETMDVHGTTAGWVRLARASSLVAVLLLASACTAPKASSPDRQAPPPMELDPASSAKPGESQERTGRGFEYDAAGQRGLMEGESTEAEAIRALKGPPYRKVLYRDGSYDLTWYHATPWNEEDQGFHATCLAIRFTADGVMSMRIGEMTEGLNAPIPWFGTGGRKGDPQTEVVEWSYLDSQGNPVNTYNGEYASEFSK